MSLGVEDQDQVEVLSGLNDGDIIIAQPGVEIQEGMSVESKN